MILCTQPISSELIKEIADKTGKQIIACKSMEEAAPHLPGAEIMIGINGFDSACLAAAKELKWLFSLSAGVEKLPFQELIAKKILVSNVGGIHGTQIAEQTLGMMIMFSRRLHQLHTRQQQRVWANHLQPDELLGKTLCIVGAGKIGIELARKAKAFDMTVIGIKRTPSPLEHFDEVLGHAGLHEALGCADYVVLLTPLTKETYHFIGKAEFDAMKSTAVFINMSRGDTVDEPALIEALANGGIGGAGLDVFHNEPLEQKNPLWGMENVIITPHTAGYTPHYMHRAVKLFLQSYDCYRSGRPLPTPVDMARQY